MGKGASAGRNHGATGDLRRADPRVTRECEASGDSEPQQPGHIQRREIRTFGHLEVALITDDGARLVVPAGAWRHGRSRSLLALLLCRPNSVLTRDKVAETLWRGHRGVDTRKNLNNALWNMKQGLGIADSAPGAPLVSGREPLLLRLTGAADIADGSCWVDALAFETAYHRMRQAADDDLKLIAAEEALALYRGDFLPEAEYEDWARERREHLRREWMQVLLSVSEVWQGKVDLERALEPLKTLLIHAPGHDEAARRAARLLAALGHSEEALALCRSARRHYKAIHGHEPPGLRALEAEIRGGEARPVDRAGGSTRRFSSRGASPRRASLLRPSVRTASPGQTGRPRPPRRRPTTSCRG
jgi:DNA-binding SARP family transcriptional activator